MAKIQQVQETDFDFNKKNIPEPRYIIERLVAIAFCLSFGFIFLNTSQTTSKPVHNISATQENSLAPKMFRDYVVTAEDKQLFEDIFTYNTSSPEIKNSDVKFFNDTIRRDDINNADFVNQDKNEKFTVSSKILSIDSPDKDQIMKEEGFANLDYVDIVVQKTYQKGEEIYYEQHMVNVKMENHKIISLNTHRMID